MFNLMRGDDYYRFRCLIPVFQDITPEYILLGTHVIKIIINDLNELIVIVTSLQNNWMN